jgi:hypothetical protein
VSQPVFRRVLQSPLRAPLSPPFSSPREILELAATDCHSAGKTSEIVLRAIQFFYKFLTTFTTTVFLKSGKMAP